MKMGSIEPSEPIEVEQVDEAKLKATVTQAAKDRTITNFPTEYPLPSEQVTDLKSVSVTNMPTDYATEPTLKLVRWGVTREPAWIDGSEQTAPEANTKLVSKTVSADKVGRVFGVHITAGEANAFRLMKGATVVKRFDISARGTIHIVLNTPLLDGVSAGTEISIQNVDAGGSGIVYQASILYDEG